MTTDRGGRVSHDEMRRDTVKQKVPVEGRGPGQQESTVSVPLPRPDDTPIGVTPKDATKRLMFNGSSYSGADIKVLVHRYDTGPEEARSQITLAISAYSQILSLLSKLQNSILPSIKSTVAAFKAGTATRDDLERVKDLYRIEVNGIRVNENAVSRSAPGYFQGIAFALSADITNAILNPDGLATSISFLSGTLQNVIDDWSSLREALDNKSSDFFMTKTLAELQTLSISTDRDKRPVRSLGSVQVKGFTRGPRTIAGTMIFTVFDRNVLWELLDADPSDLDGDDKFRAALMDQLPPIDITVQFANEYGSISRMTIYGVEFVNEGRTLSIENLLLEDVVQYVARDIDVMTPVVDKDGNQLSTQLLAYNQASAITRTPFKNGQLRASDLRGESFTEGKSGDAALNRIKRRSNIFF